KVSPGAPTYPWPSIELFYTDLLFSSPRLRFSRAQKKALLSWAKRLGAKGVPSLKQLEKVQILVRDLVGDPTEQVTAHSGNIFHINDIGAAITKDFSNPITRFAMHEYPEDTGDCVAEVFNAKKMLFALPPDIRPPAVKVDSKIFFIDELMQLSMGEYFIPTRYFRAQPTPNSVNVRELIAEGHTAHLVQNKFDVDGALTRKPTSSFANTYEDICVILGYTPQFHESPLSLTMPNLLREKAKDRMVYSVPLIIFLDDVSGNISKQWNKHHVVYLSNGLLHRQMLEKQFCVRFHSASPHATPIEFMHALRDNIVKARDQGIIAYDCKDGVEVLLMPYGLFFGGDNPMQAIQCSHGGLQTNFFCRTCAVGGTKEYKASEKGYAEIFQESTLRQAEETVMHARNHASLSLESGGTDKVKKAATASGVRDHTIGFIINPVLELGKKLRKRDGGPAIPESVVKERLIREQNKVLGGKDIGQLVNPLLLRMPGINIHLDTPVEILHTVLLGVVKYFWGQSVHIMSKSRCMDTFHARLASVNRAGLNAPGLNADYICHYTGSLIGKHFKSIAQVIPFLVYGILPPTVIKAWTSIGTLVVLLWHTSIEDINQYLAFLTRTIDEFLALSVQCTPSIIISKPKFHFLVHLPMFIKRFGPALLYSTKRYESFNHVFRLCSIHSNKKAPSRDICKAFALQDTVKHIVTGGYWYDKLKRKWVRAGKTILDNMDHCTQVRFLKGKVRLCKKTKPSEWSETCWGRISTDLLMSDIVLRVGPYKYYKGSSFVASEGDICYEEQNIIVRQDGQLIIGQIKEILATEPAAETASYVMLQLFRFLPEVHETLLVPCLELESKFTVIKPQDVICCVNVQHDCAYSKCVHFQQQAVHQDRLESTVSRSVIQHADIHRYVLNVFSIHNYKHISVTLPPSLALDKIIRVPGNALQSVRSQASAILRNKNTKEKTSPAVDNDAGNGSGGTQAT
ncbi:hypothetical protein JOM56_015401, partial [Amanita muscaria]